LRIDTIAARVVAETVLIAERLRMMARAVIRRLSLGLLVHRLRARSLAGVVARARLRRAADERTAVRIPRRVIPLVHLRVGRACSAHQRQGEQGVADHRCLLSRCDLRVNARATGGVAADRTPQRQAGRPRSTCPGDVTAPAPAPSRPPTSAPVSGAPASAPPSRPTPSPMPAPLIARSPVVSPQAVSPSSGTASTITIRFNQPSIGYRLL